MMSTKTDENKITELSEEAVEVKEAANDNVKKKEKKKKKYTVEELLSSEVELVDEYGRKRKVKVKTHKSKLTKRENRMGYIFCLPYIIGAAAFLLYPMIQSFIYMFCRVRIGQGRIELTWNNFENFSEAVSRYTAFSTDLTALIGKFIFFVPLIVVFALIMALMLNLKIRGKGIFRTIFFIPVIIVSGPVMNDLLWDTSSIRAVDSTAITAALQSILPLFLADMLSSVFQNIILILWYTGVQTLIFLAAVQKIDTSLYEAAKIDGGSNWECFWKITLPTIKPMMLLNAIYTTIYICQDTNNNAIINRVSHIVQNEVNGYGQGAVLAWILNLIIIIFLGIVALIFKGKQDPYVKQIKKNKKMEKRARKMMKVQAKKSMKNAKKYEKALAYEAKMKAKGKDLRGGREDV